MFTMVGEGIVSDALSIIQYGRGMAHNWNLSTTSNGASYVLAGSVGAFLGGGSSAGSQT